MKITLFLLQLLWWICTINWSWIQNFLQERFTMAPNLWVQWVHLHPDSLPRPEIIHISVPLFLPRPKVVHILAPKLFSSVWHQCEYTNGLQHLSQNISFKEIPTYSWLNIAWLTKMQRHKVFTYFSLITAASVVSKMCSIHVIWP